MIAGQFPERVDAIMRDCQSPSFTTRAGARKQITELLKRAERAEAALKLIRTSGNAKDGTRIAEIIDEAVAVESA